MTKRGVPLPRYTKIRDPKTGDILRQQLEDPHNAPVLLYEEFFFPSVGVSAVAGKDFHPDFPSKEYHDKGHLQSTSEQFLTTVFQQGFLHSIISQRASVNKRRDQVKLRHLTTYMSQTSREQRETLMLFFGRLVLTSPVLHKLSVYYLREKVREEKTGKYNPHLFYVMVVLTFFVNLLYSVYWCDEQSIRFGEELIRTRDDALAHAVQIVKNAWYTHEVWTRLTETLRIQRVPITRLTTRQFLYLFFPKLEHVSTRKIISMGQNGTDIVYPGQETEKKMTLSLFEDLLMYDMRALPERIAHLTRLPLRYLT